jgi:salicylate hydroxylase
MLLTAATSSGEGEPAQLILDHPCTDIDFDSNVVTFANGKKVSHDLVIGADGVGVSQIITVLEA